MAQMMIHYLIGETLIRNDACFPAADAAFLKRFLLGNLLPDAYAAETPDPVLRRKTHFITDTAGGGRYSDFERFRLMFQARIPSDGLYLGYCLHLIEDACFRVFWHSQKLRSEIRSIEHVSYLYRDYRILNRYIAEKYSLTLSVEPVESLDSEPVCCIYPFAQDKLLSALNADFGNEASGEPRYFTPELADEFIASALPVTRNALGRILGAAEPLASTALTW